MKYSQKSHTHPYFFRGFELKKIDLPTNQTILKL